MPSTQTDKLIITNLDQLNVKYGSAGANKVKTAVKKLIAADAARGLSAVLVDLSDSSAMAAYGATPIPAANAGDAKANKEAIDVIYGSQTLPPSYVMLLGSADVIPHVPLDNPLPINNMEGDTDTEVPSDLPYACDAPYSTEVQDFLAPTRVVGRLPNVTGDTDPSYLVGLLKVAATYSQRPAADYSKFLAISAHVWKTSTEMSLDTVIGSHTGMKISPPNGPKWTAAESKPLLHFVNCHGGNFDPDFYGQKGAGQFPVAHSAAWMASKVVEGTIMAAECCYGAQLYDPTNPFAGGQMGMCNTYLGRKGYAFFGSSNVAYGPADDNDLADIICQFFCTNISAGTSTGRACLQARLDYVLRRGSVFRPTDLKTLAQFNLMGDPSLTPVQAQPHAVMSVARAKPKAALESVARHGRLNRRAGLVARAAAVAAYRLISPKSPLGKTGLLAKMKKLAAEYGIKAPDIIISYEMSGAPVSPGAKSVAARHAFESIAVAAPGPRAIHTVAEKRDPPANRSNIRLVRGMQAVEYADGIEATVFESR